MHGRSAQCREASWDRPSGDPRESSNMRPQASGSADPREGAEQQELPDTAAGTRDAAVTVRTVQQFSPGDLGPPRPANTLGGTA